MYGWQRDRIGIWDGTSERAREKLKGTRGDVVVRRGVAGDVPFSGQ